MKTVTVFDLLKRGVSCHPHWMTFVVSQSDREKIFLYRTQSSAKRRMEDHMLSGRSLIKMRKRTGPRTILVALRTELGLTFSHLKLRVENVQTAMSWSTYERILISHNSLICIKASCLEPCQRPWWSPLWWCLFVYVHNLQHHQGYLQYHIQTGQAVFHKTFDFGIHADSQQECSLRLDVCLYYLWLYAPGSCSICMWATQVCNLRGHIFPLSCIWVPHLLVASHLVQNPGQAKQCRYSQVQDQYQFYTLLKPGIQTIRSRHLVNIDSIQLFYDPIWVNSYFVHDSERATFWRKVAVRFASKSWLIDYFH